VIGITVKYNIYSDRYNLYNIYSDQYNFYTIFILIGITVILLNIYFNFIEFIDFNYHQVKHLFDVDRNQ
jgi:hypothetical protein